MALSLKTLRLIRFAKAVAVKPHFLYATAHRRTADHPSQKAAHDYAKRWGLPWPMATRAPD